MIDLLFYLQDSRSNVGTCAMFWKLGGGYTSNLNEAELFQRDRAVRQYECRETDLPWPKRYIDARATKGVDCQYVDREEAGKLAESADRFYAAYRREWDGNNLVWMAKGGAGRTADLEKAATFSANHAAGLAARGYDPLPVDYIDSKSRRVVSVETMRHKQALREAGFKLPLGQTRHRGRLIKRIGADGCVEKRCPKCKQWKPYSDDHYYFSTARGAYESICKVCKNAIRYPHRQNQKRGSSDRLLLAKADAYLALTGETVVQACARLHAAGKSITRSAEDVGFPTTPALRHYLTALCGIECPWPPRVKGNTP